MKVFTVPAVALVLAASVCVADDGDDTLKRWLSRSDLAVVGTIVSEPVGIISERGVPNYICEFKVSDVCKGNAKIKDETINVNIMRFEIDEKDKHPLIEKGAESILFLKKGPKDSTPSRTTSDFWFGIQHPMPWMVNSLKRLAKQEAKHVGQTDASAKTSRAIFRR
jgi:hypothetical protein